jgi:hypothetical protein
MIYLVDTVEVDPADVVTYAAKVESEMAPVMERAGATFEHCRTTEADLGLPVTVQTTWSFADLPAWNVIRRNLVLDPEWYALAEVLADLRRSRPAGTRRFYRTAPPSPAHPAT